MKKIIAAVLLLSVLWGSCKKKEKEPSKTELLQKGKWKLTKANFSGFVDLMENMKDCQKDNFYLFNADKTITVDEGAVKCNSSSEQTYTDGNWSLVNNETQISISGSTMGFGSLTGDIVTLNSSTLQIKKDTTVSGFTGTANITFSNTQ